MESTPQQPPTSESDDQIKSLVEAFKVQLKIKDEKQKKERQDVRADRKKRRESGDEDVSSDTEDEYDLRGMTDEEKQKVRDDEEKEQNETLYRNARERFTYEKLV